jgi:hypothetical protein
MGRIARDERLGWTADAQVFWRAASYNMDLTQFSKKFAGDIRDTQAGTPMYGIFAPGTSAPNPGFGAGWSDAGVIIPRRGNPQRPQTDNSVYQGPVDRTSRLLKYAIEDAIEPPL